MESSCLVGVQDHAPVAEYIPSALRKAPGSQSCKEFYIDGTPVLAVDLFAWILQFFHRRLEFGRNKEVVGLKSDGNVIHRDTETLLDAQRVRCLEF